MGFEHRNEMTGMRTFGDPDRFEISARWVQDRESRDRLPKAYGWSMGEICVTVCGVSLTEHRIHGERRDAVQWYLGPVVAWFLGQWKWLMHEESYTWSTIPGDSAAFTVEADLERYVAAEYPRYKTIYKDVRAWWMRHALRSADPSALYPPVFIRRFEDSIEVSWLDKQPDFRPDGYELLLNPGSALLPVEEVARPLWEFLQWAITSAEPVSEGDRAQVAGLRAQFENLKRTRAEELEAAHLSEEALRVIVEGVRAKHWIPDRRQSAHVPVVTEFDMPVLMFGGLNVSIDASDMRAIFDILVQQRGGKEAAQLSPLVCSRSVNEFLQPYAHGYELAYEIRQALEIDLYTVFVDVEKVLDRLGIKMLETALNTNSIRGIAIAGANFWPTIVVNTTHKFNGSSRGRRFTIAHELCHILFDRSRAKRLSHISGPWTSGRVEKRANAFAAMFLATPQALGNALATKTNLDALVIRNLASRFEIGTVALLEHLRNLDLISDNDFQLISSASYH